MKAERMAESMKHLHNTIYMEEKSMKKMRKLMALLTAVCSLFAMTSTIASAETETTRNISINYGIVAITDGSDLTDGMLNNVAFSKPIDGYENKRDFTITEWTNETAFASGLSQLREQFGEEARVFFVNPALVENQKYSEYARRFMLANDCIMDVRLIQCVTEGTAFAVDELYFLPAKGMSEEEREALQEELREDTAVMQYNIIYGAWTQLMETITRTEDFAPVDMSDEAIQAEIDRIAAASGIRTSAEMRADTEALIDKLMTKYDGRLEKIDAAIGILDDPFVDDTGLSGTAWDGVGDMNSDFECDATDAAALLDLAARVGSDADTKTYSEQDVNADGYVDAKDAAIVLETAVRRGTGQDIDVLDVLRRTYAE